MKGLIHDYPKHLLTEHDMRRSGVPPLYWKCTMDKIPSHTTYRAPLEAYCSKLRDNVEQGRGLLLTGELGRGKTGAAACVLKRAMSHDATGFMVRPAKIADAYGSTPRLEFDAEQTYADRIESVDLLVIDDLGSSSHAAWIVSRIEEVIRHRHDHLLATIVTTNLTIDGLIAIFGKSCLSVLLACTSEVYCDGCKWRAEEATGAAGG